METNKNTSIMAVAEKLNNSVSSVLGNNALQGFQKAYTLASAIKELKTILTPEYMKPIMELQGNKLGFKTDKDKDGGYSETIVKNCLIEAVLFGLQPCGNQFNIIAGQMYATKEGCGFLLSKIEGLSYDIVAELPRVKDQSSAVVMKITWTLKGITQTKSIDIPVKVNSGMGTDAILGKATRKARKWLHDTITGSEVPEGEAIDIEVIRESKRTSALLAEEIKPIEITISETEIKPETEAKTTDLFATK